ncbi:MAG: carbonic anhydrase [Candidatus Levyibacteriota bacterium]
MSEKSHKGETFFTSVGCMDGRVQKVVNRYASLMYGAEYADTITRAGLDGLFASAEIDPEVYKSVKDMILVSVDKHKSFGIVVHGHEECAGNPVNDRQHKKDIKNTVAVIKKMVKGKGVKVRGVYVRLQPRQKIEEVV